MDFPHCIVGHGLYQTLLALGKLVVVDKKVQTPMHMRDQLEQSRKWLESFSCQENDHYTRFFLSGGAGITFQQHDKHPDHARDKG